MSQFQQVLGDDLTPGTKDVSIYRARYDRHVLSPVSCCHHNIYNGQHLPEVNARADAGFWKGGGQLIRAKGSSFSPNVKKPTSWANSRGPGSTTGKHFFLYRKPDYFSHVSAVYGTSNTTKGWVVVRITNVKQPSDIYFQTLKTERTVLFLMSSPQNT